MNHPATTTTNCLRRSGVELTRLPESSEEIAFFERPSCHRHYAQSPGHSLTYRWLHPVSLALYCILFNREPLSAAPFVAKELMRDRPRDASLKMIGELNRSYSAQRRTSVRFWTILNPKMSAASFYRQL